MSAKRNRICGGSPFCWIKGRPSRQVGTIGEALVAGWAAARGFDVQRPLNSDHDRRIEGLKVEIKFSTLWTDKEIFVFQQLRDQDYDYCFMLGVSPFDAQAWFVPKAALAEDCPPALVPQHGGGSGRDTKWLSFVAAEPPDWMGEFGGWLSEVRFLIEEATARVRE
jgi:hypothetical protein